MMLSTALLDSNMGTVLLSCTGFILMPSLHRGGRNGTRSVWVSSSTLDAGSDQVGLGYMPIYSPVIVLTAS